MDIQILASKFYEHSIYIRGYSKQTIQRYKSIINFISKDLGITNIDEFTNKDIREFFLHGRTKRAWRPNTFICYYQSLLVFFRWCVESGYLEKNPIEGIEMPKVEKRLPPKLTKQEVIKLLEIVYNYPYDYRFLRFRNHALFSTLDRKSTRLNSSHAELSRMPSSA